MLSTRTGLHRGALHSREEPLAQASRPMPAINASDHTAALDFPQTGVDPRGMTLTRNTDLTAAYLSPFVHIARARHARGSVITALRSAVQHSRR